MLSDFHLKNPWIYVRVDFHYYIDECKSPALSVFQVETVE
jgi:hypothetical protein